MADVAPGPAPRDSPERARAVGPGDSVGTLAPERRADIILVDLTGPHTQPIHDLAATLVHSARSFDVRTTIVHGLVVMHDRALLLPPVASLPRSRSSSATRVPLCWRSGASR
ncbi:cytosine/adenosine deaminase-related metal-dependent hydrolase [Streptomyces sp. V3I7]|nr:cytosine/adenosine deaminase-related metal-dependent hydrolase [Streptomyces sp. V3I7]